MVVPVRASVLWTTKPELLVHADRSPDSKPSPNTGVAAAGVVTGALALGADELFEVSQATTA